MERNSPLYSQRFFPCKEALIAMLPLVLMAYVSNGVRPVLAVALSVLCGYGFDALMHKMRSMKFEPLDLSGAVTGAVFAMLMPASVPFWILAVGNFVAIVLVKHAFGGYGNNIFNPAAVAVAFCSLMWPHQVYLYPASMSKLPLVINEEVALFTSPMATLKAGGVPYVDFINLLTGDYIGPIGSSGIVIMAGVAVYLLVRKVVDWRLPASFMATVALVAFFFPRIHTTRLDSMVYELFCTATVFGALFVVGEPVTAPKRPVSKIIYGVLMGLATMGFRYYGAYEMGIVFSSIACSALSSFIDRRVNNYEGHYTLQRQITGGDQQ